MRFFACIHVRDRHLHTMKIIQVHILSGNCSGRVIIDITAGAVTMIAGVPLFLHLQLHPHFVPLLSVIVTSRCCRRLKHKIANN